MATVTKFVEPASPSPHLRPFDARRDLARVADLVEQCFADTLDAEGERYLQQMRSAAQATGLAQLGNAAARFSGIPLSGYVWEEGNRLIGNVSLISYYVNGRPYYLVANVATHPDYRGRGIARKLTAQAMEHARRRGAQTVWLHVRENNDPAVHLYRTLGFEERARRTTWHSLAEYAPNWYSGTVSITRRHPTEWNWQKSWLRANYPPGLTWHLPLDLHMLQPGLLGGLYRLIGNADIYQWSARKAGRLHAIVAWQYSYSYYSNLWLAAAPDSDPAALRDLLLYARSQLSARRSIALDYPARQSAEAIRAAGFEEHQTLIWMMASLR